MRTKWSSLRPLTGVTRVVTWVFWLGAIAVVIANIAALGWLPGTSANETCVDNGGYAGPLKAGAYATASGTSVCVDNPTATQRIADIGDQVPQALFALAALLLLLRFLRTASQEGPYAATVPGRLAAAGWFVLVGGPVSELLFTLSQHVLRTSLITGVPSSEWLTQWRATFPWWSVVTGVGALVFAYILRTGARAQEEREGAT
jgi:hypothetical protein